MAEPIYPRAFSKLKKAYSGEVAGKPKGMLPMEDDAEAFFYVHSIIWNVSPHNAAIFGSGTQAGFWTFQVWSGVPDSSQLLFEQSVHFGAAVLGMAGGLLTAWFPYASSTTKFKTRVCDGQHVPAVVEEIGKQELPPPPEGLPLRPGLVQPFDVGVTALKVRMPSLPAGASHLELLASNTRYENYQILASDLIAGQVLAVELQGGGGNQYKAVVSGVVPSGDVIINSPDPAVKPTEQVWLRVRAVNENGFSDGQPIRDTWNMVGKVQVQQGDSVVEVEKQIAGYEGYRFAHLPNANHRYEQYYTINEGANGGSGAVQVHGDIVSPPYRCQIPIGAYLKVRSDYWVGQLVNNELYYSISYRAKVLPTTSSALDKPTGSLWTLASEFGGVTCGRSTRWETYRRDVDRGDFGKLEISRWIKGFRHGATLTVLYGDNERIFAARSVDEGRTWAEIAGPYSGFSMVEGIKPLAGVHDKNGCFLVYGRASVNSITTETPQELGYFPGDAVWIAFKEDKNGLIVSGRGKVRPANKNTIVPTSNVIGMYQTEQGILVLVQEMENTVVFRSTDGLHTLEKLHADPRAG